jgi:hypothetical protein
MASLNVSNFCVTLIYIESSSANGLLLIENVRLTRFALENEVYCNLIFVPKIVKEIDIEPRLCYVSQRPRRLRRRIDERSPLWRHR